MFFLNRDLPNVEQKILSYLGPRDLIRAKLVNKEWHFIIKSYIKHLKAYKNSITRLMLRKVFLEPVTCFATIKLPYGERAMTVNDSDEVYILSDEAVLQFDVIKLTIKAELPFRPSYVEAWKSTADDRRGHTEISLSADKSEFQVKQFFNTSPHSLAEVESAGRFYYDIKDNKSLSLEDTSIISKNVIDWRYTDRWAKDPGPIPSQQTIGEFSRIFRLDLSERILGDIVWLQNKTLAIYSMSSPFLGPKSQVFAIRPGGLPTLLAIVPIDPVRLHVIGTRVICRTNTWVSEKHYRWKQIIKINKGKKSNMNIIVFDVWNPDSVRQEDVDVT